MAGEDVGESGGADLLLAFDEEGHAHGRLSAEGAQGGQVDRDPGLVVHHAAAVQPRAALGRLEGGAAPQGEVAGRLDIQVRVEADGGLPLRRRETGDDRGLTALAHHLDVGAGQVGQQCADGVDRLLDVGVPVR